MKEFAERLREIQSQRGITRKEMAAQIGIMPASLSSYMNDTKNPTLDMVAKIAKALGVSVGWLCGEIQESSKMATYEDFLRNLVALVDTSGIPFLVTASEEVITRERRLAYFETDEDYFDYISEQRTLQEDLDASSIYVTVNPVDTNKAFVAAIETMNWRAACFIRDWLRIRELYKSSTIDEEMYNAWLEKRFRTDYANLPLPGRDGEK